MMIAHLFAVFADHGIVGLGECQTDIEVVFDCDSPAVVLHVGEPSVVDGQAVGSGEAILLLEVAIPEVVTLAGLLEVQPQRIIGRPAAPVVGPDQVGGRFGGLGLQERRQGGPVHEAVGSLNLGFSGNVELVKGEVDFLEDVGASFGNVLVVLLKGSIDFILCDVADFVGLVRNGGRFHLKIRIKRIGSVGVLRDGGSRDERAHGEEENCREARELHLGR